jgi:hypothetical protein
MFVAGEGGSINVGLTENFQVFVQIEGNFTVGPGAFAGLGVDGGITEFATPVSEDLSKSRTSASLVGTANVGWGPGGVGVTLSKTSTGEWTGSTAFIGLGIGAEVSGGISGSKTWAPFPSLSSLYGPSARNGREVQRCMSTAVGLAPVCN